MRDASRRVAHLSQALSQAWIALLSAAAILAHLGLRYLVHAPAHVSEIPLYIAVAAGGLPLLWELGRRLIHLEFGSDLLAGLSIVAAAITGQYLVGAIIVLMLSGGGALESYATERANSVLAALHKRTPRIAHRRTQSGHVDIDLDALRIGDAVVILPHEIVPVDGIVIEGHGRMDESYLTGEPFEISKAPGSAVLSGAINKEQMLVIEASKLPADSRHAQIVRLLQETEANRPRMRRLGDKLAAWYTPIAVAIAAGAWLWSGDSLRFLAVVVIATPCPLLIAIPVAIIGAISLAAKRGIILKNPAALEQIDNCRTLIFDKTGTLTYGKPVLTDVLCAEGVSREDVLSKAASVEQYSKHPLAAAVLNAARAAGQPLAQASSISEKPGAGLEGIVDGVPIRITGRSQLPGIVLPEATTGLECIVLFNERLAAVLRFRDTPRADSRPFIAHLKARHGARRVVLLSGDREEEVRYLAGQVGISEALFSKSPEEKVAFVAEATKLEKTMFVGDGINDAPAMLLATVGVALGSNSDITSEAADAVVLDSSLEKTDELIHISRRMRRIALESAVGGMVLSTVGMGIAAAGWLSPVAGAIAQEAIDVAAVLNALRVAFYYRRLADF
ncbi:MAG TPA: heavy metal translocating P-type ATPase [Bryobacteraceae bacterium]|nr:heavy metal translocating P-type ATPase [Bryobacteraceae bacterium]